MSPKATANHQKTPFSVSKKKFGGGNKKIKQRVFLVGRAGVTRPQASGLSFKDFLGNRFELRRTFAPKTNFSTDSGATRLFLFGKLGFCGAKPSCFSGGRVEIATPTSRSAFLFCRG
jgi:hypothetical protein